MRCCWPYQLTFLFVVFQTGDALPAFQHGVVLAGCTSRFQSGGAALLLQFGDLGRELVGGFLRLGCLRDLRFEFRDLGVALLDCRLVSAVCGVLSLGFATVVVYDWGAVAVGLRVPV